MYKMYRKNDFNAIKSPAYALIWIYISTPFPFVFYLVSFSRVSFFLPLSVLPHELLQKAEKKSQER